MLSVAWNSLTDPYGRRRRAKEIITDDVKSMLVRDGYVVLRNVVQDELCIAAKRVVNRSLGLLQRNAQTGEFGERGAGSFPEIRHLFDHSPLQEIVNLLVGPVHDKHPFGQIAIRYPGDGCWPKGSFSIPQGHEWLKHWHIDGLSSPHNQYTPVGEIHNFSVLVGVLLSDVPQAFGGNLVVFPGSHILLARHFAEHGIANIKNFGQQGLPKDLIVHHAIGAGPMVSAGAPSPVHILGRSGDVVLCNYLTAHHIAPHARADLRYAVYFRLSSTAFPRPGPPIRYPPSLVDPWAGWKGVSTPQQSSLEPQPYSHVNPQPQLQHGEPSSDSALGPDPESESAQSHANPNSQQATRLQTEARPVHEEHEFHRALEHSLSVHNHEEQQRTQQQQQELMELELALAISSQDQ